MSASLREQVAQARLELAEAERLRVAAWSCEGRDVTTHLLVCWGYHARFTQWRASVEKLALLERRLGEMEAA